MTFGSLDQCGLLVTIEEGMHTVLEHCAFTIAGQLEQSLVETLRQHAAPGDMDEPPARVSVCVTRCNHTRRLMLE